MTQTSSQALEERTPGRRMLELDALRGLAAFTVVWYHMRLAFFTGEPRWYLRPLFAGRQAVLLFFVLSGYVLSLPFWRGEFPPYARYVVRRVFRIYVPYAVAVGVTLLASYPVRNAHSTLTLWFNHLIPPVDAHTLELELVTRFPDGLVTAFWSLRYEFEMSLIFPLLCWLILRLRPWRAFVLALVCGEVGLYLAGKSYRFHWLPDVGFTIFFGTCFLLGALLAQQRMPIAQVYERMARPWKVLALALVLAAYYLVQGQAALPLACCGVILFAQDRRVRKLLEHAVPEYLGRISYSLYLLHLVVLADVITLLSGRLALALVLMIAAVLAFGLAHAFCVLVEEPATRLGRRLTHTPKPAVNGGSAAAHQAG